MTATIQIGRRSIQISRPETPLFPSAITNADLARYYERVAEVVLPHLAARPLNLERYPDGVQGARIIQQRAPKHFPSWSDTKTRPDRWKLATVASRLEQDGDP